MSAITAGRAPSVLSSIRPCLPLCLRMYPSRPPFSTQPSASPSSTHTYPSRFVPATSRQSYAQPSSIYPHPGQFAGGNATSSSTAYPSRRWHHEHGPQCVIFTHDILLLAHSATQDIIAAVSTFSTDPRTTRWTAQGPSRNARNASGRRCAGLAPFSSWVSTGLWPPVSPHTDERGRTPLWSQIWRWAWTRISVPDYIATPTCPCGSGPVSVAAVERTDFV
ncbi:hypothetical protein C8Q76DRAFT_196711 [Earliella scabrosa]|nr:hypothetical protein C8Q76DRAFT_196711 [Earliella scabrosa]